MKISNFFNKQIKFFGLRPQQEDYPVLETFMSDLKMLFGHESIFSVNIFPDGDHIHGEVLVGQKKQFYITRSLSGDLKQLLSNIVAQLHAKNDLKNKISPSLFSSSNNNFTA